MISSGKLGQASLRRCSLSWALRDEYELAGLRWGRGIPGEVPENVGGMDTEYSGNSGDFWRQVTGERKLLGCEEGDRRG